MALRGLGSGGGGTGYGSSGSGPGTGTDVSGWGSATRLQGILKQIQDNFEWVSETDASVELQRAIGLLRTELGA